ncbi:hypothetical protein D3Y59_09725 [Hymenobacter oligotrophus]|uniref:DUF4136 domain-containing protein n=1 Tax=Hymenobacter oligotrophus TaxID=2319843 RepID=A0A3B7RDJ1_9BACT|nr:hypothetical protein [Hymenobacter oligotrophus]AYA37306.1 hypothetical protein D3Y59_09725 [Hymenobacter oligotrophus]
MSVVTRFAWLTLALGAGPACAYGQAFPSYSPPRMPPPVPGQPGMPMYYGPRNAVTFERGRFQLVDGRWNDAQLAPGIDSIAVANDDRRNKTPTWYDPREVQRYVVWQDTFVVARNFVARKATVERAFVRQLYRKAGYVVMRYDAPETLLLATPGGASVRVLPKKRAEFRQAMAEVLHDHPTLPQELGKVDVGPEHIGKILDIYLSWKAVAPQPGAAALPPAP